MPAVERGSLKFTIEDGSLVVRQDDEVVAKTPSAKAEQNEGRYNIIVAQLLMNASFSEEEWASLNGSSVVEEVAEIVAASEETTAPEVEVAPVAKRGRRKLS
jgi:hypothetical protein